MPNYKPRMHKRNPQLSCSGPFGFGVCHGWHAREDGELTDNWSKVTCGSCLRSKRAPRKDVDCETKE